MGAKLGAKEVNLIQRCEICDEIITDEDDFVEGRDEPSLCELCQERI